MSKQKREHRPMNDVLAWLLEHHPKLHAVAEADRYWLWLPINLSGDENKAVRDSIKAYGFIFSRHGGHPLASGKMGYWGNSCENPKPFHRRDKSKPTTERNPLAQPEQTSDLEKDLALLLGA